MDSEMLASFNSFDAHGKLPGVHRESTTENSGVGKSFPCSIPDNFPFASSH
jgi:hypothetical protein